MAEYIRYKGERYKKVDSENEKSERVDTLDRRIEDAKTELMALCKTNKAFSANGKVWRHRMLGEDRCMFVLSGFVFEETDKNTFRLFIDKLTTKFKTFLNKKGMTFSNYKCIHQNSGTYEIAIATKIKSAWA